MKNENCVLVESSAGSVSGWWMSGWRRRFIWDLFICSQAESVPSVPDSKLPSAPGQGLPLPARHALTHTYLVSTMLCTHLKAHAWVYLVLSFLPPTPLHCNFLIIDPCWGLQPLFAITFHDVTPPCWHAHIHKHMHTCLPHTCRLVLIFAMLLKGSSRDVSGLRASQKVLNLLLSWVQIKLTGRQGMWLTSGAKRLTRLLAVFL